MIRKIILMIIFISCLYIVYGAGASVSLKVSLSWDNGTTWTAEKTAASYGNIEQVRTYGGTADDWGHSWTAQEINSLDNFTVRVNFSAKGVGTETANVDYIRVQITYELPYPTITINNPSPENNTFISNTVYFNSTSDLNLTACKLEHNASGSYVNVTLSHHLTNCHGVVVFPYANDTSFNYRIFGDAGSGYGASEDRTITISSKDPQITLNRPFNNTETGNRSILINFSISDIDSDLMEYIIYINNHSKHLNYYILDRKPIVPNGTYIINFSFSPVTYNHNVDDMIALYHFDNISDMGESSYIVRDYATGLYNGTVIYYTLGGLKRYSKFGGGSGGFSSGTVAHRIVIENTSRFSTLCIKGCSFGVWANVSHGSGSGGAIDKGIISRWNLTSGQQFFYFGRNGNEVTDNMEFIISKDGTPSGDCNVKSQGNANDGNYHYWLAVYNNVTDYAYIYKDGLLNSSSSCSFTGINTTRWISSQETIIGRKGLISSSQFPNSFDELAIYNRSLSAAEALDFWELEQNRYYFNISVTDYQTKANSPTWEFEINFCKCIFTGCEVNGSYNCVFDNTIDMQNNPVSCAGSGSATWNAALSEVSTLEITNGCYTEFLNSFTVTNG